MNVVKVAFAGCVVVGLATGLILPPAGQGQMVDQPLSCIGPPLPNPEKSPTDNLIGTWQVSGIQGYWDFAKDGKLFVTASEKMPTQKRFELWERKLMVFEADVKLVTEYTIADLTQTRLVLVDSAGKSVEFEKVRAAEPKKQTAIREKLIGTWQDTQISSAHWSFTKEGELFAWAFGSKAPKNRFEVNGDTMKLNFDNGGKSPVSEFTIDRLTATQLIVTDSDGRKTEFS